MKKPGNPKRQGPRYLMRCRVCYKSRDVEEERKPVHATIIKDCAGTYWGTQKCGPFDIYRRVE